MPITEFVVSLGISLMKIVPQLSQKANNARGRRQMLIRELRNNIKLLQKRDKKGVNTIKLVTQLSNTEITKALEHGYRFSKLAKRKARLKEHHVFRKYEERYIGLAADEIILKIDEKITELLQIINSFDKAEEAPYNLTSRLDILYYLCLALAIMILE